ncbi:hypothetical protein LF860_06450 [Enterococcus hirae]|uniref:hypothetical protein n=1 Tax=Enterococcus hirae TaxID=1354 RepID=UPI001CF12C15|nr:hypothetical protein [Enterococcus hirae]MCA6766315.1 hypothetical protein [Enterococcus hirae]
MNKGKNHDRQDLGFILPENVELRIRQTNKQFKNKLRLRLLGNASSIEKSILVDSEWVSISADDPLVPFIDTPYGEEAAQIEYEIVTSENIKHYQFIIIMEMILCFFQCGTSSMLNML